MHPLYSNARWRRRRRKYVCSHLQNIFTLVDCIVASYFSLRIFHIQIKVCCAHERFHFQFEFWNKFAAFVFVCLLFPSSPQMHSCSDKNDQAAQYISIARKKSTAIVVMFCLFASGIMLRSFSSVLSMCICANRGRTMRSAVKTKEECSLCIWKMHGICSRLHCDKVKFSIKCINGTFMLWSPRLRHPNEKWLVSGFVFWISHVLCMDADEYFIKLGAVLQLCHRENVIQSESRRKREFCICKMHEEHVWIEATTYYKVKQRIEGELKVVDT